jgi:putative transposase
VSWKETSVQDQRVQFIGLYRTGEHSVTDLCKSFGVSRTTGHRLIRDYEECGLPGLESASRAPRNHPNATPSEIEERIKACKGKHTKWGPKKIRHVLDRDDPDTQWPAVSTVGEILKRAGLTSKRKGRARTGLSKVSSPLDASAPNDTWCADFKGEFTLGNSRLCYPLTITDASVRILLRCQCLANPTIDGSYPIFAAAFQEYGLPQAIRTDNGAPFASTGLGGLTTLAVWWVRLGIRLDRIDKGHPEQNGRHERMHRELKDCVANPPAYDMNSQQRACDAFREEYNQTRPHEGIGMATPASLYTASAREYPAVLPEIEYPEGMVIRMVRHDGYIKWKGSMMYLSEALAGQPVGLDQMDDQHRVLYYSTIPLAILDDSKGRLLPKKEANILFERLHTDEPR